MHVTYIHELHQAVRCMLGTCRCNGMRSKCDTGVVIGNYTGPNSTPAPYSLKENLSRARTGLQYSSRRIQPNMGWCVAQSPAVPGCATYTMLERRSGVPHMLTVAHPLFASFIGQLSLRLQYAADASFAHQYTVCQVSFGELSL